MTDVTLYGFAASTYVRTARMILEEKGVAYELEEIMAGTPEMAALHPWGKMPAFRHGGETLFEAAAIGRYVDETFDGPALQPADALHRANMETWISAYIDYVYKPLVQTVVIQRLVVPNRGGTPDEAAIDAARPAVEQALGAIESRLGDAPFFAGAGRSLADFFYLPAVSYFARTPEGTEMLANRGNIVAWKARMEALDSAQTVLAA